MSTTVTYVDPFKGTVVVETERDVEVYVGSHTSIKVGGRPVEEAIATEALQIRTPEPEDQTMKVTVQNTERGADEARSELDAMLNNPKKPTEATQDAPEGEKQAPTQLEGQNAQEDAKKKLCGFCERWGKPCKRHIADPAMITLLEESKKQPAAQQSKDGHPTADTPLPEGHWWCIHCKAQVTHRSPECPKLAGQEDRRATDEEAAAFTDPWNCGRCRTDGRVCRFHRGMEASGNKPPKF